LEEYVTKHQLMKTILGIDAAWTSQEPSGVALVINDVEGWRLLKAASSYQVFLREQPASTARHRGSPPDPHALLAKSFAIAQMPVTIVAIDMPLSTKPIVGRRASDNMISSVYGARHAGTHTPNALRPGKVSDELTAGFKKVGYPLLTSEVRLPGLIEVYPHPALIELSAATRRLPYKHSKSRKYWPDDAPMGRRLKLFETWKQIVMLLEDKVKGVAAALPLPELSARAYELKAFEDALDAVVCAWVGACVIDGLARSYGDDSSAIWVPNI
jgi:predicted RNase H-like nuclease